MVIDTQVHIFERAFAGIHPANFPFTWHECGADWLVAEMDRAGVDKGFLISYDAEDIKGDLCQGHLETGEKDWESFDPTFAVNGGNIMTKAYYLDALKKYPDRFIWFTTINLTKPDFWDIWMKDIENGAVGVKLFPAYHGALPDDPRLMKVYRHCEQNNIPVIFANERWYFDNYPKIVFPQARPFSTDEYMKLMPHFENMLSSFPQVKFLLTHWGVSCCWFGNMQYEYDGLKPFINLLNKYDNAYTDIAALAMSFASAGEDYPWPGGLELIKRLVGGAGAHKVMYATDWPWCEPSAKYFQTVNMVSRAADFLTEEQKRIILGENAANFAGVKV